MSSIIRFYPVGNGDTSQIILNDGRRLLFDYRHIEKSTSDESPEIDLEKQLKKELNDSGIDYFDVVAFTHSDKDHIENSTNFFELKHAKKYQGDGRIKIKTLWVPASMIIETTTYDNQDAEFVIWRQEARHRMKEGEGIRVFSKPDKLKDWLNENNLTVESRKHLISDAGTIVPEFDIKDDGIEFFCHSPFIKHVDEGEDLRNEAALIFNIRFKTLFSSIDYLAVGDSEVSVLEDIIEISQNNSNSDRLDWDLFNIPHHCSYKALNIEKGKKETVPSEKIEELLQSGKTGCFLISSSNPIIDNDDAYDQTQPPHIQAKKCYQRYLDENNGCQLLVTMEEPNEDSPEIIEFIIDNDGIARKKKNNSGHEKITSKPAPRAGQ